MGIYDYDAGVVIFDIDGTLADIEHRRYLVEGDKKDFDAFYCMMTEDGIKSEIRGLCNSYHANGWEVFIFTGRPEFYRTITEKWLKDKAVFYSELWMRPADKQYTPDYIIKQEMLDKLARPVHIVFDDRDQVVRMWRDNGITCCQVADGNF